MEKNYVKIGLNTDDDSPLNAALKLPILKIIIRCVTEKNKKLYLQIYLSKHLYQL